MGFNTVAVLYNDFNFETYPKVGARIAEAMRGWSTRDRDRLATHFGAGIVVSQAHANYTQIVVVGKNTGKPISEANDLDWMAIDSLKQCLERHGYKVIKPRQKKVAQ